ncbi:MAG: acyl-ACP--UDP-N-acetylglucosamine O-acyltransferase [Planctomycetota bacterium]|nr:acyl-ACP--UDP-N-acetylglucosamine O-acyltransferase [Planctomycetota bacterium]
MATVHPTAVVEDGAELAESVSVGPYAVIGPDVRVGRGCVIHGHAVLSGNTEIGEGNVVHPHAVLGGSPQDLKYADEPTRLVMGDRNVVREGVTINTGTVQGGGSTTVGSECVFMANSHVAHDCVLGDRVILANNVMLAGHIKVRTGAIVNGGAGIHHFTTIGEYAYIGGLSRITNDVPPFTIVEGHPSRVRGVNVIGLKRARMSPEAIAAIKEAFKLLFRSDHPVREACAHLEDEFASVPEVLTLVEFMRAREGGRLGRQNESPRRRFDP